MLDPSVYLASFGWKGKGNGLQHGSASRPLAIPQKRTLSGLGKDRDEAFPFWDDLFAAAAKSIQIKLSGREVEAGIDPQPVFLRTKTGILSNRRPITGTPATSGTTTPSSSSDAQSSIGRASIMTIARREHARKCLYARFFKGPILGPDVDADMTTTVDVKQSIERVQDTLPRLCPGSSTLEQQTQSKRKKKRKHDSVVFTADEVEKGKKSKRRDRNYFPPLDKESRKMEITRGFRDEEQHNSGVSEEDRYIARELVEEDRRGKAAKSESREIKEKLRKSKQERRIAGEERGRHTKKNL